MSVELHKEIDESLQGTATVIKPDKPSNGKMLFLESYGCAMNFADSEIVASVLSDAGFIPTRDMEDADLILINTCSIREKAEETVRKRLTVYNKHKRKNPKMIMIYKDNNNDLDNQIKIKKDPIKGL